ncbi:unnamed protein product [Musa acuminata subsp. malaccensis]|uniref:(wild Malaysian banana) hypothetical protein n=1 Tax=Musa acuminata subsp. malaccensis TaxID=214687 RepID=A0A804IXL1_MUSAM|nr:unnamed protein product [Musa acuminata subsp. malaccensis]
MPPSFRDDRMPPVPRRWKAVYRAGSNHLEKPAPVSMLEYVSQRDWHGHGTHTASTAAGSVIPGASVLGISTGVAQGMVPVGHITVYEVCWFNGFYRPDIVAGMDDAIRDGVDVLSISLGGFPIPFSEDSIAVGSLRATERGVTVVCAAGNNGPVPSSVANEAPWIITVGASTLDRRFPAFVRMGNGRALYGESMYTGNHYLKSGGKEPELVYESGGETVAQFCLKGSLSEARIRGKMVVCDRGVNGRAKKGEAVR